MIPFYESDNIDLLSRESKDLNENLLLSEDYVIIKKIWEDLGVTKEYQNSFNNYIKSLSDSEKISFYNNEINELKILGNALLKFHKEVNARKRNIISFRKYISQFINNDNNFIKENNSMILDIIRQIQSLRLNVINITKYFLKIREITTYLVLMGKIDLTKINKDYAYDSDYLLKIEDDLNFLSELPGLQNYFEIKNKDPFLISFKIKKINNKEINIPISDELKADIDKYQYIFIQEKIKNNFIEYYNKNNNFIFLNNFLKSIGFRPFYDIIQENEILYNKNKELGLYIKNYKSKVEKDKKYRDIIDYERYKKVKELENTYELKYIQFNKENEELTKEKNNLNNRLKEEKEKYKNLDEENYKNINEIKKLLDKEKEKNKILYEIMKSLEKENEEKKNIIESQKIQNKRNKELIEELDIIIENQVIEYEKLKKLKGPNSIIKELNKENEELKK